MNVSEIIERQNKKIHKYVKIGDLHKIDQRFVCTFIDDEAGYALFRIKKADGTFGKLVRLGEMTKSGFRYGWDPTRMEKLIEEEL